MPLPHQGGADLYDGIDSLSEAVRHGRHAIGVTAADNPMISLLHLRAQVRTGDPARIGEVLADDVPALVVAVLPFLPEDGQWPDLMAMFYAWRTAMHLTGTLVTVTPAGADPRMDDLIVPVARAAGFTLIARHATAHAAPYWEEVPPPRLAVHARVRVFTCWEADRG